MAGLDQAPDPARITLVLGGARSGKSAHAEALLQGHAGARLYIATAEARDAEMEARIAAHRARRGPGWRTVEAPLALAETLEAESRPGAALLVDCLTLWLSNLMDAGRDIAAETRRLTDCLARLEGGRCWSPTRSASASCRRTPPPAPSATMPGASTRPWPRPPGAWSSSPPACRSC